MDKHTAIVEVITEHTEWVQKNTPMSRHWFNKATKYNRRKERKKNKLFFIILPVRSFMMASQIAAIQMQREFIKFEKGSI